MVHGNGKSHQRTCQRHLRERGWPLDDGMRDAIRDVYTGRGTAVISAVERGIGAVYLERRARGDKTELPWRELRELVWTLAQATPGP